MVGRVMKNGGGRRGTTRDCCDDARHAGWKDGRALQPGMEDHEESVLWEGGQRTEGQGGTGRDRECLAKDRKGWRGGEQLCEPLQAV